MQSIFTNTAQPEITGTTWLIAETSENVAAVADAERLYATEVPALTTDEWPLL